MRRWSLVAGLLSGLAIVSAAGWYYLLAGTNGTGFHESGQDAVRITPIKHVNARLGLGTAPSVASASSGVTVAVSAPGSPGEVALPGSDPMLPAVVTPTPRGRTSWTAASPLPDTCTGPLCGGWGVGVLPDLLTSGAADERDAAPVKRGRILLSWESPVRTAPEPNGTQVLLLSDALLLSSPADERIAREERIRRESREEVRTEAEASRPVPQRSPEPRFGSWMGPEDRAFFESLPAEVFAKAAAGELPSLGAPAPLHVPAPTRTSQWLEERLVEEVRIEAEKAEVRVAELAREAPGADPLVEASVTLTPEPMTLWLLASGLITLSVASLLRRRKF